MAPQISISLNQKDHIAAAQALSNHLKQRDIRHAYIGGFAWSLLGSERPTELNILLQIGVTEMQQLREELKDIDRRFATLSLKLYFVADSDEESIKSALQPETIVFRSKHNVLVEMLPTGQLGLPYDIPDEATYYPSDNDIKILHPGILILTKLKRWSTNCDSTRPKTIKKNKSDGRDIRYIVDWLFSNGPEFIRFEAYRGKTKPELLAMIRKYHDKNIGDVEHLQCLRSIMPHDWDDMLALPPPEQESSVMP